MLAEDFLKPVSDDAPTGVDLYDDPERQEIEIAFEEDANSVDWRNIIKLITGQIGRTKDIWLAIYLMRAGAHKSELGTVEAGAEFLAGMFENFWPSMYPQLDDYGFQGRKGPCESLTKIGPFIGPLKRMVLIAHPRLGNFTGEDLIRFNTEGDAADRFGMFRHAVTETDVAELQAAVASFDAIRSAVKRADIVLMANADGDTGTDFNPTYEAIDAIRAGLAPYAGLEPEAEAATEEAGDSGGASFSGGGDSGPRIGGRVDSRDDVLKAIDAIADYYQRREPGSPIPVALRRVRTWVPMDFMAILRDIAPAGVSEAGAVLLAKPTEESSSSSW
jgi:type VI secretion system protein ImpA